MREMREIDLDFLFIHKSRIDLLLLYLTFWLVGLLFTLWDVPSYRTYRTYRGQDFVYANGLLLS